MELQNHILIYLGREHGFKLSSVLLGGELFINAALKSNIDKMLHAIAKIGKLTNAHKKLVLLLQCITGRIQNLLAAVSMNLSRDFVRQHDEAIMSAIAEVLEFGTLTQRDKVLMQAAEDFRPRTGLSQYGGQSGVSVSSGSYED